MTRAPWNLSRSQCARRHQIYTGPEETPVQRPGYPSNAIPRAGATRTMGTRRLSTGSLSAYPRVTISVPVYKVPRDLLERAIDSLLGQTYTNILVIVTSDGEDSPSWKGCSFVGNDRVVCWHTAKRKGPYFAHELARVGGGNPLFAIQDADDWSDPARIDKLVSALIEHDTDAAIPSVWKDGRYLPPSLRNDKSHPLPHRTDHFWVVRSETIDKIGGYYAGVVMGADTLLTNLVLDFGTVVGVPEAVYHHQDRPGSLTSDPDTGYGSAQRETAKARLTGLYAIARRSGREPVRRRLERHRDAHFVSELSRLTEILADVRAPDLRVADALASFPYTNWSISRQCAASLYDYCRARKPRVVIDFGSGASTVAFALYAAESGAKVITLDHDPRYLAATKEVLRRLGIAKHIELRHAPIATVTAGALAGPGYQFELDPSLEVDFAFIDGPPESVGRLLTLPSIADRLAPGWEAWLHDGRRPGERECIASWSKEMGNFSAVLSLVEDQRGVYKLKGDA